MRIPFILTLLFFAGRPALAISSSRTLQVEIYQTVKGTPLRLQKISPVPMVDKAQPKEIEAFVFVDPTRTYQEMLGMGGALTDAAAEVFAGLPKQRQDEILRAYYDPEHGIGYTLARTHIHSCDFSRESYTYVTDEDPKLGTFDISHDKKFRIPLIRRALEATGGKLKIFAAPWSPPAFMKDNHSMLNGGHLKPEFSESWARYYIKFLEAYKGEGIPIWGLSVQNEPLAAQKWESCEYSSKEERTFLSEHLGPALRRSAFADTKILGWDHNRDFIFQRTDSLLSDPTTAPYVWGMAYHWYENWTGGESMPDNIARVHEAFPKTPLVWTESTIEKFRPEEINNWEHGERYATELIHDFNNGASGAMDWNILLDENGGPNHAGNDCFAAVHANSKTGKLTYTNIYYYIGHFSKFIKPGAVRIAASSSRSRLLATSFKNPDGSIATVVLNTSNQATPFFLWRNEKAAEISAPAHSIQTLLMNE